MTAENMSLCRATNEKPICAICDATNATMQLCDACRADPANADWQEGDSDLVSPWGWGDLAAVENRQYATLGDARADRARTPTELERRVLELVAAGQKVIEQVYQRTKPARRTVTRPVVVALSFREIARRVGCSHTQVRRIIRRLFVN